MVALVKAKLVKLLKAYEKDMIANILNGYHVERISQNGEVEVLRRSFNSGDLYLISPMERLPVILPTPQDDKLEEVYVWTRVSGRSYYRYMARRLIAPKFAYITLLPKKYTYTNYVLSLPKSTTHYKRIKKLLINGNEIPCVKCRGLESRFHVGPNIGLFHNPWEKASCFALYYINPNNSKAVDLKLCLDVVPIEEKPEQVLLQIYSTSGQHREESNLIQQVINKSFEDFGSLEVEKIREQVGSARALESMLHLMIKNTRFLLRKLKRLGIEIQPAGKHQYKAKNLKTGNTAPIPWRGEFQPHDIKKFCQELQIDYNTLLEDP